MNRTERRAGNKGVQPREQPAAAGLVQPPPPTAQPVQLRSCTEHPRAPLIGHFCQTADGTAIVTIFWCDVPGCKNNALAASQSQVFVPNAHVVLPPVVSG